MSQDLIWLTLVTLFTALLWAVYVLNRFAVVGVFRSLENPSPDWPEPPAWAKRAKSAHANAIENLVIFAILVLISHLTPNAELIRGAVSFAAALYFFARVAHFILFTTGIPYLRTVAFLAGFTAQMIVAYQILLG